MQKANANANANANPEALMAEAMADCRPVKAPKPLDVAEEVVSLLEMATFSGTPLQQAIVKAMRSMFVCSATDRPYLHRAAGMGQARMSHLEDAVSPAAKAQETKTSKKHAAHAGDHLAALLEKETDADPVPWAPKFRAEALRIGVGLILKIPNFIFADAKVLVDTL